jgi:nicotinate-nucleotide adenylyltransferase
MLLGMLGGTFDPPHLGHLQMAEAALTQLHLDRILIAPAGIQPLKIDRPSTPPELRARMVELAIADQPRFELSRIDLDRPGPHYTVDLLSIAHRQFPQSEFWFIMGEDSLADLLRWRDPARLITLARLALLRRPGYEPDWSALEKELPNIRSRIDWIDHPEINISARDIRRRVHDGLPIDARVPIAVADYIKQHNLYQS